jgi:tetratricopeptide (TPR) repeat protein
LDAYLRQIVIHLAEALSVVGEVCLLHYVYFVVLPRLVYRRYWKTDPELLRRYLERAVATPSLLCPTQKLFARASLAGIYLDRRRHAEAATHLRANIKAVTGLLRYTGLFHAREADYRRRLADCLEALGQVGEAAEERRRAEEGVERAPTDTLRYLTRGKLLEGQNRHSEAYAEFQKALDLTPASQTGVRIQCMVNLVRAAYRAGRPADCLSWAEEAVELGATGTHLRIAYRMAGLACGNLGRLEWSEQYYRRAYKVAAAEKNQPAMADILGSLAGCLYRRGKLAEADEACIRATAKDPETARVALAIQSQIHHARGRYDDALAAVARLREATPFAIPRNDRRVRAAYSLDAARMEADCGRTDDAWRHVREALAELGSDAKLGFRCQAALSWVHAVRGDAGESQRLAARLESELAAFENDPGTCRAVLYDLAMAAAARGDHSAGIACWTRYLTLRPHPVYRPGALYHRGECYRHLGRLDDARGDYQAAVALTIDTHFARLARQRLGEVALL